MFGQAFWSTWPASSLYTPTHWCLFLVYKKNQSWAQSDHSYLQDAFIITQRRVRCIIHTGSANWQWKRDYYWSILTVLCLILCTVMLELLAAAVAALSSFQSLFKQPLSLHDGSGLLLCQQDVRCRTAAGGKTAEFNQFCLTVSYMPINLLSPGGLSCLASLRLKKHSWASDLTDEWSKRLSSASSCSRSLDSCWEQHVMLTQFLRAARMLQMLLKINLQFTEAVKAAVSWMMEAPRGSVCDD